MELNEKDFYLLTVAIDIKEYIASFYPSLYEEIMVGEDGFYSDYELVKALCTMIKEKDTYYDQLLESLTDTLDCGMDDLISGVLILNDGRQLALASRILFRLEFVDRPLFVKPSPLPDFVKDF